MNAPRLHVDRLVRTAVAFRSRWITKRRSAQARGSFVVAGVSLETHSSDLGFRRRRRSGAGGQNRIFFVISAVGSLLITEAASPHDLGISGGFSTDEGRLRFGVAGSLYFVTSRPVYNQCGARKVRMYLV